LFPETKRKNVSQKTFILQKGTMTPILKDVKQEVGDAATIVKIDVDKNPKAASQYQVKGVPTLILFKKGKALWRQSGVVQKTGLLEIIKKFTI